MWKRSTVQLLRHRQTKEPATDGPYLNHRATSRLYRSRCQNAAYGTSDIHPRMTKYGVRSKTVFEMAGGWLIGRERAHGEPAGRIMGMRSGDCACSAGWSRPEGAHVEHRLWPHKALNTSCREGCSRYRPQGDRKHDLGRDHEIQTARDHLKKQTLRRRTVQPGDTTKEGDFDSAVAVSRRSLLAN